MLEKPKLSDDKIVMCMQTYWTIHVQQLEFLPIGNDSSAWVFRVESDTKPYFLKIRQGIPKTSILLVPEYLNSIGIKSPVAPIRTNANKLYVQIDGYVLILYDWIHGTSAWHITLSDEQWQSWGGIMKQIHMNRPTPSLRQIMKLETFRCKWEAIFHKINKLVQSQSFDDSIQKLAAKYWKNQQVIIDKCFARLQNIGQQLQMQEHQFVICHADIHTANIMIDEQNQIRIVDWDEVIIAPKERDLTFFTEDGHASHKVEAFLNGYGETNINQLAITYYHYEWVVQEFGDYGERIFLNNRLSDTEKQFALDEFIRLFSTGDVVEMAFASDKKLKV